MNDINVAQSATRCSKIRHTLFSWRPFRR